MANIQKRGENSYCFTVSLGKSADNKYKRRTKTIKVEQKMTPKKLKEYLEYEYAKFKQEVETGEYISPEKMTLSAFTEEWREKYANKNLSEKTMYGYNNNLKNRVLPALGHLRLDQITTLHIVDFLDSLMNDGSRQDEKEGSLSNGTVELHYRVLNNILTRAVEWKVIKNNPAKGVKKPTVRHKEVIPYDESEVAKMLEALEKEPYHWKILIKLALTSGLRRGELLGLEWKHIDWKTGIIDVVQSVSISKGGVAQVKEPKTRNGKRKVALPASMLNELREYYSYRVKERDKLGDAWKGGDFFFMFAHPDGQAFHQERPYLWFRGFLKKNNLRYIRFHDLRHTSATILINQGVHAKIISERLGHGDIQTTMNIYGHALRSADQAAADKFEKLFSIKAKDTGN